MIERGHDNLRLEYAAKLSKLYKCTVDDIETGENIIEL